MKYLVLETHIKHAIVLDEEGRFLKVVNNAYTVGQKVDRVTMYHDFTRSHRSRKVWFQRLSIAAACLIIALFSYFQIFERPIAAMHLSVNPSFRIEWNRLQKVTDVEPENAGAMIILENYSWKRKDPSTVVRELIGLCNLRGYFKGNNTVTIKMEDGDKNATQKVWDELESKLPLQLSYIENLTIKMVKAGELDTLSPAPSESSSSSGSPSSSDSSSPLSPSSPATTSPAPPRSGETTKPTSSGNTKPTTSEMTKPTTKPAPIVTTRPIVTPVDDDSEYDDSDYDDGTHDDSGYDD